MLVENSPSTYQSVQHMVMEKYPENIQSRLEDFYIVILNQSLLYGTENYQDTVHTSAVCDRANKWYVLMTDTKQKLPEISRWWPVIHLDPEHSLSRN